MLQHGIYPWQHATKPQKLSPADLMATTGAHSRELSFIQTCPLWPPGHRARRAGPYDALGTWGGGVEITLHNRGCSDTRGVGLDRFGRNIRRATGVHRRCIQGLLVRHSGPQQRASVPGGKQKPAQPGLPRGDYQIHPIAPAQGHTIRAQRTFASGLNTTPSSVAELHRKNWQHERERRSV